MIPVYQYGLPDTSSQDHQALLGRELLTSKPHVTMNHVGKTNFANEHKVSIPTLAPTFVLPVEEIALPMCHKMVWLAIFTEPCLGQPILTYRGAIRVRVGKKKKSLNLAQQELIRLSDIRLTLETLLKPEVYLSTSPLVRSLVKITAD